MHVNLILFFSLLRSSSPSPLSSAKLFDFHSQIIVNRCFIKIIAINMCFVFFIYPYIVFHRSSWEGGGHFRDYGGKNSIKITLGWRFLINFNCHPLKACSFVKFNNHKKTTAPIIYLFLNWIICTLEEVRETMNCIFFVVVASDFLLMFLSCERKNLPKSYQLFFALSFFLLA